MASAKESSVSLNKLTDEEALAQQEGRLCRPCRQVFKKKIHFDSHVRVKHSGPAPEAKLTMAKGEQLKDGEHVFFSPKAAGLRIVIPGFQGQYVSSNTGAGGRRNRGMKQGLYAEFKNGLLKTSNKRIVAYLTGDVAACKKLGVFNADPSEDPDEIEVEVYNDPRYPVFDQGQMREMALTL